MSELQRTPANRRAARLVTASIVAGGLALAGGSAYANSQKAEPVPAAAPVAARPAADPAPSVDPEQAARDGFYAAGYTYDDAVALGAQWNLDSFEAKAEGGRRLAAGETLPIAPGSAPAAVEAPGESGSDADSAALDAYFAAGYDYDDAVALGKIWNVDFYEAKVTGGQKLIAGETLPVAP
ncbi:hypothetical protein [Kineococcus rhizosphaerae]|nr:hypothetical protein [Kineococcus rhizosphaerae]